VGFRSIEHEEKILRRGVNQRNLSSGSFEKFTCFLYYKGVHVSLEPPQRGNVVRMIGVMETPLACVENAPSISRQCNDVVLHLLECFSLQEILTSIHQLNTLQRLSLTRCFNLRELLTSIDQLNAFRKFYLTGCSSLLQLPPSIDHFNAQENFHLLNYLSLQELSTSIGQLSALQKFALSTC
jgi:hypothetical protein